MNTVSSLRKIVLILACGGLIFATLPIKAESLQKRVMATVVLTAAAILTTFLVNHLIKKFKNRSQQKDRPDAPARKELFKDAIAASSIPYAGDEQALNKLTQELARLTNGYSSADIKAIVSKACTITKDRRKAFSNAGNTLGEAGGKRSGLPAEYINKHKQRASENSNTASSSSAVLTDDVLIEAAKKHTTDNRLADPSCKNGECGSI